MINIPKFETVNDAPIINFKNIESESFIDPSIELKPQPIALSLGETLYKGHYYPTPIGSYGDFSCIVGASKSRKTFIKSLIVAGYLGGNANLYSDIIGHNNKDKFVLEFCSSDFNALNSAERFPASLRFNLTSSNLIKSRFN